MPRNPARTKSLKRAGTFNKHLCRVLRDLRRKKGMSIEELSAKAGVTEYMIRRIESSAGASVKLSRVANPAFPKVCRLALVLAGSVTEVVKLAERSLGDPPMPGTGRK